MSSSSPARHTLSKGKGQADGPKQTPLSVRFAVSAASPRREGEEEGREGEGAGLGGREGLRDAGLESKVRTFLDDVTQFTSARRQGRPAARRPDLWGTGGGEGASRTATPQAPLTPNTPHTPQHTPGPASSLGRSTTRASTPATPVVAKRYNTWSVDQNELLTAFDQFCLVQNTDELARVVRLASKLKAGVKMTRNQSIVPTMAAFRGTRAFKALISK